MAYASAFIILLAVFALFGLYPFGPHHILQVDASQSYAPRLLELFHKIKNGESLFYSWRGGLGADFYYSFVTAMLIPFIYAGLLLCGECKANGYRSGADITLGDYWGGCLKLKEFDDGQGVSAVIIRSARGGEIYGEVSSGLDAVPADIAHIARFNHNLEGSSKHHPGRAAFFDDYRKGHNFKYLAEKHIRRRPALILKRTLGAKTLFWLYDICKK